MGEFLGLADHRPGGYTIITVVAPNSPKTPLHSFRVDTDLWLAAKAKAEAEGRNLSEVLRDLLWAYTTGAESDESDQD